MCYESLRNGEAAERSLAALRRDERPKALLNGTVAGLVVAAVLLTSGTGLGFSVGMSILAVAFGAALHQAVLVIAVLSVRVFNQADGPRREPT